MTMIKRLSSCTFRALVAGTLASGIAVAGIVAGPASSAQATPASSAHDDPSDVAPRRWSYVWQRWDGTNYSSQATCLARGRTILKHYPDVQAISCRKPCGRWWLYTYRQQWV